MEVYNEIICVCNNVRKQEIENAIKSNNISDIDEVGDITDAGTDCGACHNDIEDILFKTINKK